MTGPDPYLDARRLYFLSNAVPAIAGHLGIVLDRDGNGAAVPEDATLVEAVAALLYARHTTDPFGRWEDIGPLRRAAWLTTAEAVVRLTAPAEAGTTGPRPVPGPPSAPPRRSGRSLRPSGTDPGPTSPEGTTSVHVSAARSERLRAAPGARP
jgi:hypothetical protein